MYERFAYEYDRLMADMPYDKWLAFLQECFHRYGSPRSIVDLGCGTGQLSIPLAEEGCRVTGIDLSADMLKVAADKAEEASLAGKLKWSRQDMREWKLEEQVDLVFSFCDCLNYILEEEGIRQVFRRTYAGLEEGGLFVFDVHAPSTILAYAEEQPFVLDEEDVAYIWTCDYDSDQMVVTHDLTFFAREAAAGDRFVRFREQHRQRAYSPDWLSEELRRAGFIVLDRAADFHWSLPDEDAERIFFVVRKPHQS